MSDRTNKNTSRSSYSGYNVPCDIDPSGLDEDGEETTRRVAVAPTFAPPSTFDPIAMSRGPDHVHLSAPANTKVHAAESVGLWKLESVPTLPEYHSLERTAVFVPHASPTEVSKRISEALRQRSVESFYDDEKAKVRCTSADGVDFRVRLYRGRGRFSHGIIVEVQRRFGISVTFHFDTVAILNAAEGKASPLPSSTEIPMVSDTEDDYEPCGASSLKMVTRLLSHDGYDSYYLAFQTLQSLTDAAKMGTATARAVAKELMNIENNEVGYKVLSLILDNKGEDEVFKLRSMAMVILANALQVLNGNVHQMILEQLRPVLIRELRNAEKTPRNAVQAARAIEVMLPHEQNPSDIHSALEIACRHGSARHAALERQAKRCLERIA